MVQRTAARWPTTPGVLLPRLRNCRDVEAWEIFEDLYSELLVFYGVRRGLQHADAEDIAQKVLADVSRQMEGFEYCRDRGRFRSWLATIANRAIWRLNHRRAALGEVSIESLAEMEDETDRSWASDFNEAVLDVALKRIRPEYTADEWKAFELTRCEDLRAIEIATQFQRPVGWVYQLRYRVLQRLKREIEVVSRELDGPAC